ncbi:Thg1 C terminal domain-containing protein [Jimgerdemannia flammicorona]|uniref:tRNA(His) guanylyltransferase n=1 Tax=Jimgerdemannia flammicorona TaxID=994334 RepID=A0A433QWN2_9FUNG|nr:Thg1 C terminal domain-containing protein [Jimgerdemannia flammicorona]
MAKSKYEYVKQFELDDSLLPNTWLVVRIDGRGFHKFATAHGFTKPNDRPGLDLMNACAVAVMKDIQDVVLAYGESDEYSFVLHRSSNLYTRRASKIASTVVSLFAASYVFLWSRHFPEKTLQYPPCFDARVVCYPSDSNLRDYLCWRQADCHINNLYNTCFWEIVHSGRSEKEAEDELRGTVASEKNEMLFSRFGINYNAVPEMFRKGSVVVREEAEVTSLSAKTGLEVVRRKRIPTVLHVDIIGEEFWKSRPELLGS